MKKITLVLLGVATLFFFISCGSKPKNEEAENPAAPDDTTEIENGTDVGDDTDLREGVSVDDLSEEEALKMAQSLYNQVLARKKKIDDENLASYDQKNYLAGFTALADLDILMKDDSSTGKARCAKANDALAKFNAVIRAAYRTISKDARDAAYKAKKDADSVKAGVAEKATYQQAAKDFQDGDTLYSMQDPEKAYDKYVSAKEVFTELYESVSEKRAEAAAAIEAAKAKVAESANFASKADNTAPITDENVDGIEDEDEQLLEDDNFDDPENAVADIPADIDDIEVQETDIVREIIEELNNTADAK